MNMQHRIPPGAQVQRKKRKAMDNALVGLLAGLVFGLIGLTVVYFIIYQSRGFDFYLKMFTRMEPTPAYAAKNISLAMICNLAPFYFFLNRKLYQSTKGVIIATGIMGLLFILYKFVW